MRKTGLYLTCTNITNPLQNQARVKQIDQPKQIALLRLEIETPFHLEQPGTANLAAEFQTSDWALTMTEYSKDAMMQYPINNPAGPPCSRSPAVPRKRPVP